MQRLFGVVRFALEASLARHEHDSPKREEPDDAAEDDEEAAQIVLQKVIARAIDAAVVRADAVNRAPDDDAEHDEQNGARKLHSQSTERAE